MSRARQLEIGRQDADDTVRLAVEPDVAADDGPVGAEVGRPQMPYVRITNLSASGFASSSVKPRPRNGWRWSVEKNDGVTARARSCSGLPVRR